MLLRFFQRLSLKTYREDIKQNQLKLIEEIKLLHQQLFLNNPVLIVQNVKMYLPLFYVDHIQKIIYNDRNFYEIETLEYLQGRYGNFKNILDIGSNIGNHMLFYCSKMQAQRVICFEPNDFNHSVLIKNIELNNLQQIVTVHNCALGETAGKGVQKDFTLMNTGMNRIETDQQGAIDIKRLDDFGYSNIDFVKIDVEGFEVEVLKGAGETITRCKPVVMIEVFEINRSEVEALMEGYGYKKFITLEDYNNIYIPL